ncbi:hypothetical protein [Paracidobacterium acidisoli]|uniref:hypothetical protein n=1 Tax=Paracidobacterium acidisoli TaxID=2303751 RepID=UPI0011C192D6|nr:hypothetical protein [Paracidobacterium acidisoli]MBT9330436.1 hypothetical protein [Paracidobacterium acidisoli]
MGNSVYDRFSASGYKFVSSLTTLEFEIQDGMQTAHFVQDRVVKILKDDTSMPHFSYGTSGRDTIDQLLIDNQDTQWREVEKDGSARVIAARDEVRYGKGTTLRCIFRAHSENGYPEREESQSMGIRATVDNTTIFVIFPIEKPPVTARAVYRKVNDTGIWRDVKTGTGELRYFTRGRRAYVLEAKSPKMGNEYRIQWTW